MQETIPIRGKKILILGLGLHGGGGATARWLARHGASLLVSDLKKRSVLASSLKSLSRYRGIRYRLGAHHLKDIEWADYVVANPGVPRESHMLEHARSLGKPIYNEATLFFNRCKSPIVAVTGTRGKSTTAAFIAAILSRKDPNTVLAGNIKTSFMLDVVDRISSDTMVVLELSSWQLEGLDIIKAAPDVAVVTNLYPDHLNRYKTLAGYYCAKKEIWKHQKNSHYLVLNNEDAVLRDWQKEACSRTVLFGRRDHRAQGSYISKGWFWSRNGKKSLRIAPVSANALLGEHNVSNVLAAIAAARLLGARSSDIAFALKHPPKLSGREEVVRTMNGIIYVNDTTATTPVAGIAALKRFGSARKKKIILIAGGADKKLDYGDWAGEVRKYCSSVYLLSGDASAKQAKALGSYRHITKNHTDLRALVHEIAAQDLRKGDVVLFSPAAASFNLWSHEFERGDAFVSAVGEL